MPLGSLFLIPDERFYKGWKRSGQSIISSRTETGSEGECVLAEVKKVFRSLGAWWASWRRGSLGGGAGCAGRGVGALGGASPGKGVKGSPWG